MEHDIRDLENRLKAINQENDDIEARLARVNRWLRFNDVVLAIMEVGLVIFGIGCFAAIIVSILAS